MRIMESAIIKNLEICDKTRDKTSREIKVCYFFLKGECQSSRLLYRGREDEMSPSTTGEILIFAYPRDLKNVKDCLLLLSENISRIYSFMLLYVNGMLRLKQA